MADQPSNSDYLTSENIEHFITEIEKENEMPIYNLMHKIKIPDGINPIYYDVYLPPPNQAYQTISYKFYKTIKLWWLICLVNNIYDPTKGSNPGIYLKILKPEIITQILSDLRSEMQ